MKNNLNIMALCGALIAVALLSGCGCYIYGDWVDIGDGGTIDGGAVRVVEIGQWFSETAVVSLPFSEMFTGLTDDNGNRIGMMWNFGVPRYVLLLPLFVMFFLLFLIGDKKKKKNGKVIKG